MGRIGQPTAHDLIEARCLARQRTPQAGDCETLKHLFKPSSHRPIAPVSSAAFWATCRESGRRCLRVSDWRLTVVVLRRSIGEGEHARNVERLLPLVAHVEERTTMQEPSIADRIAKGRQEFNDADRDSQASQAPVVPPTKATPTVETKKSPVEPPKTERPATGESGKASRMTDQELKLTGQKLFKDRHFPEAIPLLKLATEAFPNDLSVWRDLVLAASSMTRHDEAVEYATLGTKHHPSDGWLWRQLGEDLIALGRLDEAEEALNKGLVVEPGAPWLWRYFARLHRKRKHYVAEAEALEHLVVLGKTDGNDLNMLGIAYHNHSNFAMAIDYYRRSATAFPVTAFFNMGLVFQHADVSQDVDATDAFRRALLLNPNYDKAKEQLEVRKQKLIPLAIRARKAAIGLIQPDECFRFYASPFEALNLNDVDDVDSLEPKTIQRAKRELLSEIELDGSVSWLDDYRLDKARAIALVDELDDPTKRFYHFTIFQNKPLLRFLTRGEIDHFLYSDDYFPQETLELLDDDPEFEDFISKPFAQQYDLLLSRGIDRFELDVVEALFDGRRWVTAADQDACYQRTEKWVADLVKGIQKKRIASEAGESKIDAKELGDWLSRYGITTIFNLLPAHFRPRQNELVREIRLLGVSWYNQHDDAEMSRDVLAVCKQFRFKSEELNQRLEKDFKTVSREIAEKHFVKTMTALIETVRIKRAATAKRRGTPGLEQAEELLKQNGVEELFKRFPVEFRNDQTQLAAFTRSLAVDCFNEHGDPELSRVVLNLCKRFQFEDAELTESLEKDFKSIDEILSASRIVKRPASTSAKAKGQEGSTWFGFLVFALVGAGLVSVIYFADSHRSNKTTTSSRSTPPPTVPSQPKISVPSFPSTPRDRSTPSPIVPRQPKAVAPYSPSTPRQPAFDIDSVNQHLPSQLLPESGEIRSYVTTERIAPFEIRSSRGTNYLVKLVDAFSGKTVLTVFVSGGIPVQVDVPLGNYVVKYASGQTWYGYEHLFGRETGYSKAQETFSFRVQGDTVSGYTITLYKVENGNLSTKEIRKDEF